MADKDDTELKPVPGKQAAVPAPVVKEKERESDADISTRRKRELDSALAAHRENIKRANEIFPTPNVPFGSMSNAEKRHAREKLKLITKANRTYHTAVRETCKRHRTEDAKRIAADEAAEAARAKEAA